MLLSAGLSFVSTPFTKSYYVLVRFAPACTKMPMHRACSTSKLKIGLFVTAAVSKIGMAAAVKLHGLAAII